jgi:hypothetical protein
MEKFSLYEFMSFFLPGVIALSFAYCLTDINIIVNIPKQEVIISAVFLASSLLAGLIIHRVTFLFIEFKWYASLIYRTVHKIVKENKEIEHTYQLTKACLAKEISEGDLFDEAYYFLEYYEKIAVTKVFQSMYFFIRNLFTLTLMSVPVLFILIITHFDSSYEKYLIILGIEALVIPLVLWTGNWYRMKMIEKLFNHYYIAISNHESSNRKPDIRL